MSTKNALDKLYQDDEDVPTVFIDSEKYKDLSSVNKIESLVLNIKFAKLFPYFHLSVNHELQYDEVKEKYIVAAYSICKQMGESRDVVGRNLYYQGKSFWNDASECYEKCFEIFNLLEIDPTEIGIRFIYKAHYYTNIFPMDTFEELHHRHLDIFKNQDHNQEVLLIVLEKDTVFYQICDWLKKLGDKFKRKVLILSGQGQPSIPTKNFVKKLTEWYKNNLKTIGLFDYDLHGLLIGNQYQQKCERIKFIKIIDPECTRYHVEKKDRTGLKNLADDPIAPTYIRRSAMDLYSSFDENIPKATPIDSHATLSLQLMKLILNENFDELYAKNIFLELNIPEASKTRLGSLFPPIKRIIFQDHDSLNKKRKFVNDDDRKTLSQKKVKTNTSHSNK
ncbi:uncharacterized protein KGF55_002490 [Candida pseudojiufengensis]|uniref:uncharacterized protein n=1 Tax=Candida pseudojiufengensis TaxID=497109 RepID=UPI00222545E4|nr:uncharacterized protein KGF55_002490 [Candida pseudojiufengensis]KAI5963610.1 hypothetical protein KGF55_002490 [Candida pseudojiufengensis]